LPAHARLRRLLAAATAVGVAGEMAAGHLGAVAMPPGPRLVALAALAVAVLAALAATVALLRPGLMPDAVARASLGLLMAALAAGTGVHLEAVVRGAAAPPPFAPLLGATLLLVAWVLGGAQAPPGPAPGAAAAAVALASWTAAAASAYDHARRAFSPLPWTLLAPAAGWALGTAALVSLCPGNAGRRARAALPAAAAAAWAVGAAGVLLHARAPAHRLPLPLLQRLALPPPLLAPAALALVALWALLLPARPPRVWVLLLPPGPEGRPGRLTGPAPAGGRETGQRRAPSPPGRPAGGGTGRPPP
jgi:hypothetical protein